MAVGGAKAVESVSDVFYGLLQRHERLDRVGRSMMLKGPLSFLALAFGVWQTAQVFWGAIYLLAAWTIVLLAYDIPNGFWLYGQKNFMKNGGEDSGLELKRLRPLWEWPALGRLTLLALPMGIVTMLISLESNIPRYFIENAWGERELGIFSAIAAFMAAGNAIILASSWSAAPRLANYYADGNRKVFTSLLGKLLVLASCLGIAGIFVAQVAGHSLLAIVYRPEYADHANILLILMIAAGILYLSSYFGTAITAARYFRPQLPLFVTVNLTLTFFCFWLIPKYGLWGAALAVTFSAIVQFFLSALVTLHVVRRLS